MTLTNEASTGIEELSDTQIEQVSGGWYMGSFTSWGKSGPQNTGNPAALAVGTIKGGVMLTQWHRSRQNGRPRW